VEGRAQTARVLSAPPSSFAVAQASQASGALRPRVDLKGPKGLKGQKDSHKAVREVAELPDVVVPCYGRSALVSRNVPSVQQLLQERTLGKAPDFATTASTTIGLPSEEATMMPADAGPGDSQHARPRPPRLPWQPGHASYAEQTACSAFEASVFADSLAYTEEDAELSGDTEPGPSLNVIVGWEVQESRVASGMAHSDREEGTDMTEEIEEEIETKPEDGQVDEQAELLASEEDTCEIAEVSAAWSIEDGPVDSDPRLAELDSNGLLCDALQRPNSESSEERSLDQVDTILPDAVESPRTRESARESAPSKEPLEPSGQELAQLERRSQRMSSQITHLYNDVVKDLDARARAVWDELYSLFQTKIQMASEFTDEDQNEIERYVFEQLPTESTDLIWKVYKVLHLEQERDRCLRLISRARASSDDL